MKNDHQRQPPGNLFGLLDLTIQFFDEVE